MPATYREKACPQLRRADASTNHVGPDALVWAAEPRSATRCSRWRPASSGKQR